MMANGFTGTNSQFLKPNVQQTFAMQVGQPSSLCYSFLLASSMVDSFRDLCYETKVFEEHLWRLLDVPSSAPQEERSAPLLQAIWSFELSPMAFWGSREELCLSAPQILVSAPSQVPCGTYDKTDKI